MICKDQRDFHLDDQLRYDSKRHHSWIISQSFNAKTPSKWNTENNKRKSVLCILTVVLIFFCYKQIIHAAMNAFKKFTFEKQIYNNYKMPYIYIIIMLM